MARPLRIEYAGACYHVINRGNQRLVVYRDDYDYEVFLEKLHYFSELFRVQVCSYCLMPNHFHLYLKTPQANLSKFMQSFLTSFTIVVNRRHNISGHLFQGRFKSFLVEDEAYGSRVSRYIHLNPIRVRSAQNKDALALRSEIREFAWSSYGRIIGLRPCPRWLNRKGILCRWGTKLRDQQKSYSEYVETGILRNIDDTLEMEAVHSVLGTDRFVDTIRRGLTNISEKVNIRREAGQHSALHAWIDLESVIKAVANEYKVDSKALLRRYNRGSEARQVLLYLASTCCRGRYSLSELAERLGPISIGALSRAREKIATKLGTDKDLKHRVRKIQQEI